jgi:hypothetical protein
VAALSGALSRPSEIQDLASDQSFSLELFMTNEKDKQLTPDFSQSEHQNPQWTFRLIGITSIEAGEMIAPAILEGNLASEFTDLHMIANDLSFALECLKEANKIGPPNSDNMLSKALIFSAVVAYARPFKTGVRGIKMDINYFSSIPEFKADVHNYLIAIRDKHVVHSVNEFEQSKATGVMIGRPQGEWRPAGVGVTQAHHIGLSGRIVEDAIAQITDMLRSILADIDKRRPELFQEFHAKFAIEKKWELAPIVQFPDRENVAKRRT